MESYDAMLFRKADEYMSAGSGPSGNTEAYIFRELGGESEAELTLDCCISEGRSVDSAVVTAITEDGEAVKVRNWHIDLTDEESEGIAADYWMACDEDAADRRAEERGENWG